MILKNTKKNQNKKKIKKKDKTKKMLDLEDNIDLTIKIVLIGNTSVGKTNLLSRYTKNEFKYGSKPTIGTDFHSKTISQSNTNIKIQFWDTAGQEKYNSLTSAYYKDAHGIIIVYDITKLESFQNCQKWLSDVESQSTEKLVFLLIGNKSDLVKDREVKIEDGVKFARDHGMRFMEVSALSNEGNCVGEAFQIVVADILEGLGGREVDKVESLRVERVKVERVEGKGCCV